MKITDVRVLEHERAMPPGMGPATTRLNVVTIATEEGIEGHVFVSGPGVDVTPQLLGPAKQLLVGRDALDIGAIWNDFRSRARMFDPTVQGYVDIALWDIAGKAAGLPLHRLEAYDSRLQWEPTSFPSTSTEKLRRVLPVERLRLLLAREAGCWGPG